MKSKSSDFIPLGAPTFGTDDINEVIDSLKVVGLELGQKLASLRETLENMLALNQH